ncbi:MAG: hypothetical protein O2866_02570 [archaeon]|jgi:hypothetical protein|nr:hypothetical protein [archaeon]MDA1167749.1 hypothetical protein [archaeon]
MIGRLFAITFIAGMAGLAVGMADSAFRHYYYKIAEGEDRKSLFVHDVEAVKHNEEGVDE